MSDLSSSTRVGARVLSTTIDALGWGETLTRIATWSAARRGRVVCICNAHSLVTARQDPAFAQVLARADMCTPDGAPIAWMLRRLGFRGQARINGPDLMWRYCEQAARRGESIYLYGGTSATLHKLQQRLVRAFPALQVAGAVSPPFRVMSAEEDAAAVAAINASGAGTVWVGLGCPKQELWMDARRDRVNAVMIGVGAAFDYHAGLLRRAPQWMQNSGLEWLHRLWNEPNRLWRRYLFSNSLFMWAALRQLLSR